MTTKDSETKIKNESENDEDDDIIVPNSHIEMYFGSLISFPTNIKKFQDYLDGFVKDKNRDESSTIRKIAELLNNLFHLKCYFCRFKELKNGFCFAEYILKSENHKYQTIVIVYISNNGKFKYYLPVHGNSINRLSGNILSNSDLDKFWLWEETHWGEKRPHGPIDVSDSEFDKICISFDMIEKEIENMSVVKPKNSVPQEELAKNDKGNNFHL